MVHCSNLIVGKKYRLDGLNVGTFLREDTDVVIFKDSQLADKGESEIDKDEEDDYEEIVESPKLKKRKKKKSINKKSPNRGGTKRHHKKK